MIAGTLGFQITLAFFMLLLHRDGLRLIYRGEDMGGFYKNWSNDRLGERRWKFREGVRKCVLLGLA